ncbi:MAG: hypothetical protein JNL11_06840 [Bdellovibrionaceae bacterium]|nr:hypothetical protein [Pseudobdellovibrionaceae bacterium]
MKTGFLSLVVSLFMLSGCVSLNSVSLTSVPAERNQRVKAEAERFIFLGFNFDNDYVNSLTSDLKNQCPNGTVSGVLTKSESIAYFLFFFWKSRVTATGYCVPSKVVSGSNVLKKRRPTDINSGETGEGEIGESVDENSAAGVQ